MNVRSTLINYGTALLLAALPLLGGCETPPVRLGLKLAPSALGESLSLQQHLHVEREGRTDDLDVAVEIDAEHIELVGLAFGQRVLTLHYDGTTMKSWRHLLLPPQVRSEDVLEDIQLTYWPVEAIRPALPEGWRIEDEGQRRTLWSGETQVMVIDYSGQPRWNGKIQLQNLRYGYRLTIQSISNAS
jgi:hypothetical protein